ncbi:DUF885 domain-containing protein [Aliidiomarina sedimenti]|uniref:DUF885 domain-containing protein n=1 Tax=Aliidiomarina sedimenti TaxID=1933879 RepID=A0ABY0C0B5_9GAMM|nr:DUF885 family protein [Aliidiomarina sedimenti]RUO30862.1 DUF885 domain-containing protein [Aliidiomarina sedimenti]
MRLSLVAASVLMLSACASTTPSPSTQSNQAQSQTQSHPDRAFTSLAQQAWDYQKEQSHPQDGLLDISPQALAERHAQRLEFFQQLEAIDARTLSTQNRINRDMIMYSLANDIDQYEFNAHLMPLTNEFGFHSAIASLAGQAQLVSEQDYANHLQQLRAIPAYFEQQMAYMRQGIEQGITQPAIVLSGFTDGIQSYVAGDPRESVFYRPFAQSSSHLSEQQYSEFEMEAQTVIATEVNTAYQDFYDFMQNEYLPNARRSIAATALPHGERFYTNRAQHYTTTDLTPAEIHQIGLDEVARIRAEMREVIEEVGFDGSFAEFIQFLRSDDQFYAGSDDELLREAAYIAKRADAALPALFRHLPRTPYGVEPVPAEIAPNYTTGRYVRANRDDQPGFYWVNTYALDRRPLYELEALTLHEAVPGHHLQIALAQEMDQLPEYRREIYISAFGEGWGLYAEYLGLEMGFYTDPYSNFGRLTYEMWRAARLVVDTGMHTMGWSRDRAVEYMASNTALSMHNVNTEIDRYISWPGQALSYKLGALKIKELRALAEEQLGNDFDVREFHYQILKNGSVPLQTLEANIQRYLEETAQ